MEGSLNQERSDRNRQRLVNHSAGSQCEDIDQTNVVWVIPVALAGALLVGDSRARSMKPTALWR